MPSAAATTLLRVAALPDTPRLTTTAGLDEALDLIEAHILHRTRLAYRHGVDDLAALRAAHPAEEPLPPILLIADVTGGRPIDLTPVRPGSACPLIPQRNCESAERRALPRRASVSLAGGASGVSEH